MSFVTAPLLKIPTSVQPGESLLLEKPANVVTLMMNGEELMPLQENQYLAVAGVYGGDAKVFHGRVETPRSWQEGWTRPTQQRFFHHYMRLEKRELNSGNELRLPASVRQKLEEATDSKRTFDRNQLITALSTRSGHLHRSCWTLPVESVITSHFAAPRTLPSGRSYYHSGVDLRARTGTPILSAGAGEVVFAGHMTVPGNNVIIDHGYGLFSRYLHLDKVEVQVGQQIQPGTSIGLAGDTGRVEAAHLHWEVIWKGQHADPIHFLKSWNATYGLPACNALSLKTDQ